MKDEQLHRLAYRAALLISQGRMESPYEGRIDVIVRSTRADWSRLCLQVLFHCTRQPLNVIIVPDIKQSCTAKPPEASHLDSGFEGDTDIEFNSESDSASKRKFCVRRLRPEAGIDLPNLALSLVKAPFFIMLDDAVAVTPGWLTKLLWPFYENEQVMISSPIAIPIPNHPATLRGLFEAAQQIAGVQAGIWNADCDPIWSCLVVRSRVLADIGGLDCTLPTHRLRIVDWYLRARSMGHLYAICRDTCVHVLKTISAYDIHVKEHEREALSDKWNLPEIQYGDFSIHGLNSTAQLKFNLRIPLSEAALRPPLVSVLLLADRPELESFQHTLLSILQQTYTRIEIIVICNAKEPVQLISGENAPHKTICLNEELVRENIFRSAWFLAEGEYMMYVNAGDRFEPDHVSKSVCLIHRNRSPAASLRPFAQIISRMHLPLIDLIHVHPHKTKITMQFEFDAVPSLLLKGIDCSFDTPHEP